jgi:hypothetical protein
MQKIAGRQLPVKSRGEKRGEKFHPEVVGWELEK